MERYWAMTAEKVVEKLKTDCEKGLSDEEAIRRLTEYGENSLEEEKIKSPLRMVIEQFKDYLVIILIIASVISFFLKEAIDGILILAIVILNALIGTLQEYKAEKSITALKKLSQPFTKVIREGKLKEVNVTDIVVGDVVVIGSGDVIPADGRLIEAKNLRIDEAPLTGESVPAEKTEKELEDKEIPLGDRKNMVYMGTNVVYGRGKFIITATGMNTEIGKIASLIRSEKEVKTPLQIRLEELGKILGTAILLLCAVMFVIGSLLQNRPLFDMFLTSVSLAVAAIPEGLPAIITITLALGIQKMVKRNAIIRRLSSVETLGSTSVICSDKTGTLTENKMAVVKMYVDEREIDINEEKEIEKSEKFLIESAALCTDVAIDTTGQMIGDPTEIALVVALNRVTGLKKEELEKRFPRVEEIPFESERKMMSTIHSIEGKTFRVITKGAPDYVIKMCGYVLKKNRIIPLDKNEVETILRVNEKMGQQGLRILGVAYKELTKLPEKLVSEEVENDLIFIGLVALMDPPRKEVREAVEVCKRAGIKPVMITGDHKITASVIAREIGILEEGNKILSGEELEKISDEKLTEIVKEISVFARVSPQHKLRIVKAWQKNNAVVAVTGDGVNDAPALKQADIGIAMGITGTEVAKEASDMILKGDNFATIVAAVEEGRTIFANIKKAIHYLLSCNFGEIFALFVATILGMSLPLKPVHILWANLVTDSLPALAFGFEPSQEDIMKKPPRPKDESIFSGGLIYRIPFEGAVIGIVTLIAFIVGLEKGINVGRTMAFAVMNLSELVQALNVKSEKIGIRDKFSNKHMVIAFLIGVIFVLALVMTPLNEIFDFSPISYYQWNVVILLSLIPLLTGEIMRLRKNFR
ncbi:Ca2+-transporting ATPase [Caldanaerobacter subterraneus subsp. tengcongensis MB4]|uniref:P-type Ca(2+) transporter n=2 Tax=Caldanaerobacter subterraneus TaxID=911092 RepID=Q8RAK0_CALS4|nr:Cation transport ATPases [Caldanaerobacter subterraneus subsp. tengcongensis MB4]MCS3915999.1 Ca2+-transporting ATPase [Caldanaerobacter subterraneus subsp. tengcongensis MB4]